ncbi:hypothetical protein QAD02_023293 [Eretmocerus hayati]|uniref:Uncharacterized protein n=1 Tax=Eretmocerus hayati TaxID=131215 RepID=A0ACC2PXW5_9HYME|nr:hypothetical protein QAD02_023293 [Eretmocerus hayati]
MANKRNRPRARSVNQRMKFLRQYGKLYSAIKRACEREKKFLDQSTSCASVEEPAVCNDDQSHQVMLEACDIKVEEPDPTVSEVFDSCKIKLEEPDDSSVNSVLDSCNVKLEEPDPSASRVLDNHHVELGEFSETVSGVLDISDIKLEVAEVPSGSSSSVLEDCDGKLGRIVDTYVLEYCDTNLEVTDVTRIDRDKTFEVKILSSNSAQLNSTLISNNQQNSQALSKIKKPGVKFIKKSKKNKKQLNSATRTKSVEAPDVNTSNNGPAQFKLIFDSTNVEDFQTLTITKDPWAKFIKNDKQLNSATGIESFKLLKAITGWMKVATVNKYETEAAIMKTENRVVMTYLKLKQNLKYQLLALMFDRVSARQCKQIFKETVRILSNCMKTIIQWLPHNEIVNNLPKRFDSFRSTRVMIDCIRITPENQKKHDSFNVTDSFVQTPIAKAILGVSPTGTITYVSGVSKGNWDESLMFEVSNLPQLLEASDAVMLSQDFPTELLTRNYIFKFIQSPLKIQKSYTKRAMSFHDEIEKARKIIDNVHRWIKSFQILNTLPNELIVFLDQILMIICGTFNLSTPMIIEDEIIEVR